VFRIFKWIKSKSFIRCWKSDHSSEPSLDSNAIHVPAEVGLRHVQIIGNCCGGRKSLTDLGCREWVDHELNNRNQMNSKKGKA
jgi:hypothetical protein